MIGTYILQPYARTEAHIRDLADCGIDVVMCMQSDRKALDLFAKYGVGAVVNDVLPGWWGGNGEKSGMMHTVNTPDKYEAAAAAFRPGSSSAKTLTHLASSSTINQSDGMQYGDGKST